MTEKGHDVWAVVRPQATWLEQLFFLPPEKIIHLPLRNSLDVFSAIKLAKIIREKKVQIVHAHPARDYSIAALAVRLSKSARLVLTRHVFFRLSSLYKFLLPENTVFIAPTKEGKRKLLKQNILPPGNIRLIYYGIDVKYFVETAKKIDRAELRKQLNLPDEKKLVGIAGEITEHKGQSDFVRAAKIVLEKFPDTEFLIIGQDSSSQKQHLFQLEELIAELGLSEKIRLLGFWKDVAPLYSILDVFVSASRVEPFGLVIAEASAGGCAIVATATAGANEIIIPEETGKIVPIEDAQAIAQGINDFLGDENNRSKFIEKARLRIEENFSLEEMIEKTVQLYKDILRGKSD